MSDPSGREHLVASSWSGDADPLAAKRAATVAAGSTVVERGHILAYRVFDIGDTITLDVAERILAGARRFEMGGPLAEGLVIPARPLAVELDPCEIVVPTLDVRLPARASAHIFDFGAVSFLYEIPIEPGTSLASLTPICDALYDAEELDARGSDHRTALLQKLGSCVEAPHDWSEAESYTVIFVEKFAPGPFGFATPGEETSRPDVIAKLLIGETSKKSLSPAVRDDVLRNTFSYLADDLVIVDWNSALVVEPSGSRIVPFLLEFATCQLLEFRYYDGLLEAQLTKVYDQVEKARPRLVRSPYGALTRNVLQRYMELTEFTERVDNAIKLVGDVYLARVYLAGIRRFRVPEWRASVESKLRLISRAYDLLKGETDVSRGRVLEIIIVVLILIEVIAAMRGG